MANGEKLHSQGEVDLLVAVAEVRAMQRIMSDSFAEHKREDDLNFNKLYDADKLILAEVAKLPETVTACGEKIKTETLSIARKEFATVTDFKVFKTWVITGVLAAGAVAGTISTVLSYIIMATKIGGSP